MIGCLVHINISLKAIILMNMEEKHRLYCMQFYMRADVNSARQQQFDLMVFRDVLQHSMMH